MIISIASEEPNVEEELGFGVMVGKLDLLGSVVGETEVGTAEVVDMVGDRLRDGIDVGEEEFSYFPPPHTQHTVFAVKP